MKTAIAQSAERTAFNRVVEGSSPSGGVFLYYYIKYFYIIKKLM